MNLRLPPWPVCVRNLRAWREAGLCWSCNTVGNNLHRDPMGSDRDGSLMSICSGCVNRRSVTKRTYGFVGTYITIDRSIEPSS